jgi:hypothetical protein
VGRAGLTFARLASERFASEGIGDMGQSGTFAPVNRKLLMPATYHSWIEGFPPMCANESEGKFMRACDFLERARRGSLQEKIETKQNAAEDGGKRNTTP